jgi:hypothetical protein
MTERARVRDTITQLIKVRMTEGWDDVGRGMGLEDTPKLPFVEFRRLIARGAWGVFIAGAIFQLAYRFGIGFEMPNALAWLTILPAIAVTLWAIDQFEEFRADQECRHRIIAYQLARNHGEIQINEMERLSQRRKDSQLEHALIEGHHKEVCSKLDHIAQIEGKL